MELEGKKILVVDDDQGLSQMVQLIFEANGATVVCAYDGYEGVAEFYKCDPDLVILDVLMPGLNGWQICQQIRSNSDTPIIMLTTLSDDQDIVRGLDDGADDYIEKPFSESVLVARANSVLRRVKQKPQSAEAVYDDGHLQIDFNKQRVFVEKTAVKISATELKLLTYFLKNSGHVLTYEKILNSVWGEAYSQSHDYVHVYVSKLRQKIEKEDQKIQYFFTEHGIGYRFEKLSAG